MKYMGSKAKFANELATIFIEIIEKYDNLNCYVEPFVGGANMIEKMNGYIPCIGSDKNKYLISLYQNLDKIKDLPDIISFEEYKKVRESFNNETSDFPDWYKGAVGFLSSYNGRFFDGGYSGIRTLKNGSQRNYYLEAKKNLIKQSENLDKITWRIGSYSDFEYKNCFIYCDPPYYNTKQYGVSKNFDYNDFWEWVREMSKDNFVVVSEHTAPDDFGVLWQEETKRTIDCHSTKVVTEKLFIHKSLGV